jgi:hypothetical protein
MKSRLLEELVPQVKLNSNISDARYWGFYSICGLLLRLRELYRFDSGIMPWEGVAERDISDWIGQREALWEELSEEELSPIRIEGDEFEPFEAERINARLIERELLYGAGYGLYGKPVFFLADLYAHEVLDGYDVFTSGQEYARDLSIHPAMLQHKSIFARNEISTLLMWEKFEELRARRTSSPLSVAFSAYGIEARENTEGIRELIKAASASELRTYIHHELGEAFESEKIGAIWSEMLSSVLSSKASMFARAAMDTLADASEHGMLRYIIDEKKAGSLAFYMTFLGGYRKTIASDMAGAFNKFTETGNWTYIESARKALYEKASLITENILDIYRAEKNPEALIKGIQREITLLQPE